MEQDVESGKLVGSMYGVMKNPNYNNLLLADSAIAVEAATS